MWQFKPFPDYWHLLPYLYSSPSCCRTQSQQKSSLLLPRKKSRSPYIEIPSSFWTKTHCLDTHQLLMLLILSAKTIAFLLRQITVIGLWIISSSGSLIKWLPWLFYLSCVSLTYIALLVSSFFSQDFIYLFLERGKEGEGEGEKCQCVVASHMPTTTDPAHNPGMCPKLGISLG